MDLSVEEANFVKISNIFLGIIPKYLRKFFIKQWNERYPNQKWQTGKVSGQLLLNELPEIFKKDEHSMSKRIINHLSTGNEEKWDTTILLFAILYSGLKLVEKSRQKAKRTYPLLASEEIEAIKEKRRSAIIHVDSMLYSSSDFRSTIAELKNAAKNIFGEDAVREITEMENAKVEMRISEDVKQQLHNEILYEDELKGKLLSPFCNRCK